MDNWKQKRIGHISASRLDDLMGKGRGSVEWGQTAISYLYQIEMERYLNEPPLDRDAPALRFGRENETYAVAWLRENFNPDIRYYEEDFDEKPFITVDWAKFGATPDTDTPDGKTIVEIKTTYSDGSIYTYFSPTKPYEKKRAEAFKEHRNQIAGQFLACPDCETIWILKYNPQRDDSDWDLRSPLDPSRGIMFSFTREEMGSYLEEVKARIIKADEYLNTGLELDLINEYYKK
jgi:hypothetical protein